MELLKGLKFRGQLFWLIILPWNPCNICWSEWVLWLYDAKLLSLNHALMFVCDSKFYNNKHFTLVWCSKKKKQKKKEKKIKRKQKEKKQTERKNIGWHY